MLITNVTNFRKNIFGLLEQAIEFNEPVYVNTKKGNAVVISAEEYSGMKETLYLLSNPTVREQLLEGKNTPTEEFIPEDEVEW